MGKIKITRIESSNEGLSELSIESILRGMKVSKQSGMYYVSLGSTEVEISADLMKDLIENTFMMLNYEDQKDLITIFESYLR